RPRPATLERYPLSLHDALPILREHGHRLRDGLHHVPRRLERPVADLAVGRRQQGLVAAALVRRQAAAPAVRLHLAARYAAAAARSEEHTSELQSRENLVCRLLL